MPSKVIPTLLMQFNILIKLSYMDEMKLRESCFPQVPAKLSNLKIKFWKTANVQTTGREFERLDFNFFPL